MIGWLRRRRWPDQGTPVMAGSKRVGTLLDDGVMIIAGKAEVSPVQRCRGQCVRLELADALAHVARALRAPAAQERDLVDAIGAAAQDEIRALEEAIDMLRSRLTALSQNHSSRDRGAGR